MKNNVKVITVGAVTIALTIVMGWMPYVFLVPLLFTCVTRSWKIALFESAFFGVLSLVYSFIMPTSFVAIAFTQNPWIPIVPRIAAGMGCYGVYTGLKKLFKSGGKASVIVPVTVACAVGSVLNTATVVPCLVYFGGNLFGNYNLTAAILVGQTLISGAIELAVSIVVVPTLAVTVGRALRLEGYYYPDKAKSETETKAPEQADLRADCEYSAEHGLKPETAEQSECGHTEENAPEH